MPEEIIENFLEKVINNWRKVLGCIIGFILGVTIMKYGLVKAIIIFALAFIGYKLGDVSFSKKLKSSIIKKLKED